jgi:CelD/BcsL family acetyltransferase involved in cellulose biosynthesis
VTSLRLEAVDSFDAAAVEWAALARRVRNPFAGPLWAEAWWRHFGAGRRLHLIACRDAHDALVGMLPLYTYRERPSRVLRFVGNGPGDLLGPVCEAPDRVEVAAALRRTLRALRARFLLADQLPADEGWEELLDAQVLRRENSPVLDLRPAEFDAVVAHWSSSQRRKWRMDRRRLAKEHEVAFRVTQTARELDADFDVLIRLHQERWGGVVTRFAGPHREFHREFAHAALAADWLQLSFLEVDGEPVAATYNLRFANTELQYQQGRSREWDKRSVGFISLSESIRRAHAAGLEEFRYLRGDEDYKLRMSTGDPGTVTLGIARGPIATATLRAATHAPHQVLTPVRQHLRT